ncbi:hypothetical protein [Endozoicomonas atrinae]|uniref:hypothetical protein n=1 Tax=Endozoicomonas atrinae TaxID=1333660 RepID=UPI00082542AF|nr:hypothetical protein [Endozoicomonas atrinae]
MSDQDKIWVPTQCDICGKARSFNELTAIKAYFASDPPDRATSTFRSRADPYGAVYHCKDNAVCKHHAMEIAQAVRNHNEREVALH